VPFVVDAYVFRIAAAFGLAAAARFERLTLIGAQL
jgi:hypothetical protein